MNKTMMLKVVNPPASNTKRNTDDHSHDTADEHVKLLHLIRTMTAVLVRAILLILIANMLTGRNYRIHSGCE